MVHHKRNIPRRVLLENGAICTIFTRVTQDETQGFCGNHKKSRYDVAISPRRHLLRGQVCRISNVRYYHRGPAGDAHAASAAVVEAHVPRLGLPAAVDEYVAGGRLAVQAHHAEPVKIARASASVSHR